MRVFRNSLATLVLLSMHGSFAFAQNSLEFQRFTKDLATVLAGENFCNISYDQSKVIEFINKSAPPTELQFTRNLSTQISLAEGSQKGMSETIKLAHWNQIMNAAREIGFLKQ